MRNKIIFLVTFAMLVFLPFSVNAMEIFISPETGEDITLEVESSDMLDKVKEKISSKIAYPPENMILSFQGTILEDIRSLADYNIKVGDVLDLTYKTSSIKITLEANGGTFDGKDNYIIEEWKNELYDTLPTPTKEGYTFKGYYTEKESGTKLEAILNESGFDSNMTFYAHWEENKSEEENPNTTDNLIENVLLLLVSSISLIVITINLRKTKANQ